MTQGSSKIPDSTLLREKLIQALQLRKVGKSQARCGAGTDRLVYMVVSSPHPLGALRPHGLPNAGPEPATGHQRHPPHPPGASGQW